MFCCLAMDHLSSPFCYKNGEYLFLDRIAINPYDLGFLRGYAVFDVMPIENGKPFLWERHFARLCKSAEALHLRVPVDEVEYKHILDTLLKKNIERNQLLFRTVLSGGPSENGFLPKEGVETFLVLTEVAHACPATTYASGVKTVTLSYERPIPQVKLANHVLAIRDVPRRQAAGAFETLYINGDTVSEASQSNLFIVKNKTLITTWDNVLWGITQGLVIELAEKNGLSILKQPISRQELFSADEVFLTGSSKHIVPVIQIDDAMIGAGTPGPITRRLMALFDEYVQRY